VNEIVNRRGSTRAWENRKPRPCQKLILLLAFVLSAGPTLPSQVLARDSRPTGTLIVQVANLRNDRGQVVCTLFTPADRFPDQSHKGMTFEVPIKGRHATCSFKNLPYGYYAVVAFHDENHDGNFNQNWLGMPEEGFGFSDNPGALKKPVFDEAKVLVDRPRVDLTIRLNYWF